MGQAYAAYQRAMDAGDMSAALRHAREAAQLSRSELGREHNTTATLLGNYAVLLIDGGDRTQAVTVLKEVDDIHVAMFGPDALQRIETQLVLASLSAVDSQSRRGHLQEALRVQQAVAPDDSVGYARTATRVGALLSSGPGGNPAAAELLSGALRTLESEYGSNSVELVETLSALADAEARIRDPARQLARYERALRILRHDPVAQADLYLRAGRHILVMSSSDQGLGFLRRAHSAYRDALGAEHPKTGYAALALGELEIFRQRERAAESRLLEAVEVLSAHSAERVAHLRALTLLVTAYERQGRSDRATPYVMQIAQIQPWQDDQPLAPLVRFMPRYPQSAYLARQEGWVLVEFDVDTTGRVANPVVAESAGADVFKSAALDAIRQFRYAPRFENGVAVDTIGAQNLFTFALGQD